MVLLAPDQKARLQDYCASSVFIKVLMLRGYSFDETSFPRISFRKKVRTSLFALIHQMKTNFQITYFLMNSAGGWCFGGLGSGLHADFEQSAAGRECDTEEGVDPGSLGRPHLSLCPSSHCSPGFYPTPSSWWQEERSQWKHHLETTNSHFCVALYYHRVDLWTVTTYIYSSSVNVSTFHTWLDCSQFLLLQLLHISKSKYWTFFDKLSYF